MMKSYLLSLMVGFGVGVIYHVVNVKSPAPPLVALAGLLGMVIGEPALPWLRDTVLPFFTGR